MQKNNKRAITATEIIMLQEAKYRVRMNYLMAKALVEGKVKSDVLRYAEMIVSSGEKNL